MRLDKFLKNTRLLKRRTAAKRGALSGHIYVNGRPAKPAKDVKAGDVIAFANDEGSAVSSYRVVQEALRSVPKGRESEYYVEEETETGRDPA
ncbi:MAG: S4 domain-containing protein [Acidobacteriota bacterium]